jgi:hypothetical protein
MNKMTLMALSVAAMLLTTGCTTKSDAVATVNVNKTFKAPIEADAVESALLNAADKHAWTLVDAKSNAHERVHRFKKTYEQKSKNYHRATVRGQRKIKHRDVELIVTHSGQGYAFKTAPSELNSRMAGQVEDDIEKLRNDFYMNLLPHVI